MVRNFILIGYPKFHYKKAPVKVLTLKRTVKFDLKTEL